MGIITLTDRISVRVTAKNDTESSNQNKRDGGNVASALGGTGLTDSEKEEIGEGLGETVTGEDGKTYAKIGNVATMYSKLYQDGKLSEPSTTYRYGNVAAIPLSAIGPVAVRINNDGTYWWGYIINTIGDQRKFISAPGSGAGSFTGATPPDEVYSIGSIQAAIIKYGPEYELSPGYTLILYLGENERFCINNSVNKSLASENYPFGSFAGNQWTYSTSADISNIMRGSSRQTLSDFESKNPLASDVNIPVTEVDRIRSLTDYGEAQTITEGGPKIDPTKSDADIAKDIEDAATANNAIMHFGSNPTDTYVAVTDANGNPLYFLGT